MKLTKSILISALFLAFTAVAASAAPVPDVAPAETQAVTETQPSDVFGASVLSQSADCIVGAGAKTASLDPWMCGSCSPLACRNLGVGDSCGSGVGGIKYCRDWSGLLCSDGGARCQCTNTIIP